MATTPLLSIGASKEAVKEARDAIMAIVEHKHASDPVKLKALEVLSTLCSVHANITGCSFYGDGVKR